MRGAGTHAELSVAYRCGIPVYLVLGMPVEKVSGWILGCATRAFSSFAQAEELFQRDGIELAMMGEGGSRR